MSNLSAISSLESKFDVNDAPAWYTSLPVDAKSYFMNVAPKIESTLPIIKSPGIAAGLTAPTVVVATGFVNSTVCSCSSTKISSSSSAATVKSTSASAIKPAATSSSSAVVLPLV
jgi:hypothetical protein